MALETVTYVGDLVATNPTNQDQKQFGDNHINNTKKSLLNSFAGWLGMILVRGTEAQGGTANDYVVTISPAPAAYTIGLVMFKATHTNTGAATLQINALSAKTLKDSDGNSLQAGDITSGAAVLAYYDGTDYLLVTGNDRVARDGDTYTGTHDATGATLLVETQPAGDNSTKAASTAFVVSTALNSSLPGQSGFAGGLLTTDGTNATWTLILDTGAVTPLVGTAFATTTGTQTLTNKKLASPGFVDASDATKQAHLVLSGVTAGQDRVITLEDKDTLLMTPGWVALSTITASASATMDFETTIDSTYDTYALVITGIRPTSDNVSLYLRTKMSGSYHNGASDYEYTLSMITDVYSHDHNFSGVGQIPIAAAVGNDTDRGLAAVIFISNPASTAFKKRIRWETDYLSAADVLTRRDGVAIDNLGVAAITGLRLLFSTNTIAAGKGTLFGIRTK